MGFPCPLPTCRPLGEWIFLSVTAFSAIPGRLRPRNRTHVTAWARCSIPTPVRAATSRMDAATHRPVPTAPRYRCWSGSRSSPAPRTPTSYSVVAWCQSPPTAGNCRMPAIAGYLPEGSVRVEYTEIPMVFSDRSPISLRKPDMHIDSLGYGPMHPETQLSARIAPPMTGKTLIISLYFQMLI